MTYDLAIIGGGPAGIGAGVYAARKKIKTLFITTNFENQSTVSENIQNWIGTPSISGIELAKNLEAHLKTYAGESLDIHEKEMATKLSKKADGTFLLETNKGSYEAKTVLIATGSMRRKITVPGADVFENKGITYCATCDGPLFGGADVVVIGGGNSAFESALQLIAYCKSVTVLARSDFKADAVTVHKFLTYPNAKAVANTELLEITGDKFVNGLSYKNENGEKINLPVTGVFVEAGAIPTVGFIESGLVKLNAGNQIVTDPMTQMTSQDGIWAAGDCTDGLYKQNNIAVGDAVKALENIYIHLKAH